MVNGPPLILLKPLYLDTILKFNNLIQVHTNTIYNIFQKKIEFQIRNSQIRNVLENFISKLF